MNITRRDLRSRLLRLAILAVLGLALPARAAGPLVVADAQEAAKHIGKAVFIGVGPSMPANMIRPMRQVAEERYQARPSKRGRTRMYWMVTFAGARNFGEDVTKFIDHRLLFVSPPNREAAEAGRATAYRSRNSLYQLARRLEKGQLKVDTVVVRVSLPNQNGEVSLGPTGDLTAHAIAAILKRGGKVIAEMSASVPFTAGTNKLRHDQLSVVYRGDDGVLPEYSGAPSTGLTRAIAKNIAPLVPDDRVSTLQVGIGGALVDVGAALQGKPLRIWSEMGSNWVHPLLESKKNPVTDATFSFVLGDTALYKALGTNAGIRLKNTLEVNSPKEIRKQPNMVAINTALQVDLAGNANAERIDKHWISMPGGQPDFMKGAALAKGGKTIMALRSTNRFGGSSIVVKLDGPKTTPGRFVHHVVTEWGRTRSMKNMSVAERAFELLTVTHPLLRLEMAKQALADGQIEKPQFESLKASIHSSIAAADVEIRRYVADQGLARQLITAAEHQQIVEKLTREAPQWANPPQETPPLQPPPI